MRAAETLGRFILLVARHSANGGHGLSVPATCGIVAIAMMVSHLLRIARDALLHCPENPYRMGGAELPFRSGSVEQGLLHRFTTSRCTIEQVACSDQYSGQAHARGMGKDLDVLSAVLQDILTESHFLGYVAVRRPGNGWNPWAVSTAKLSEARNLLLQDACAIVAQVRASERMLLNTRHDIEAHWAGQRGEALGPPGPHPGAGRLAKCRLLSGSLK